MPDRENYMDQFDSPEAFIRHQISANKGTQNVMDKSLLVMLANTSGVKTEKGMTKDEIYLKLRDVMPVEEIATHCVHLGVGPYAFQQKFGITNAQLKRLVQLGFIQVTGKERFRCYGKYREANLYSVFDYFRLTKAEVDACLESHFERSAT